MTGRSSPPFTTPLLVLTTSTPFLASGPYKAAAEAPLSTVTLAISFGLIEDRYPRSAGTPSSTNKGLLLPVKERIPLKLIFTSSNTPLFTEVIFKPETLPCKPLATFTADARVITSLFKVAEE